MCLVAVTCNGCWVILDFLMSCYDCFISFELGYLVDCLREQSFFHDLDLCDYGALDDFVMNFE